MKPPLVELQEVSAVPAPGGPVVLAGVVLTLRAGECLALVGPSGAGKTTLLRTISGQLAPAAGQVRFEGAPLDRAEMARDRAKRARIGLITQRQDLVDSLPVHANVMAGALGRWGTARALRHLLRAKRGELAEAEAALGAVGLADKLRRRTSQLSGGEQQRVAIARALVQEPSLLLADEPVASLDRTTAEQVLELLTGLARERGMGLICSLHQPRLAERFCDRIVDVRGGTVIEWKG